MALVNHPFPFDITNLLSGAVSVIYAPVEDVDIPTRIEDVVSVVAPYDLEDGWAWLGATSESFTYTRGFETEGLEIQQVPGAIAEEVTDITRTVEVSMAEFSPFGFQLMENAPTVATIAAAAGSSAQKKVAFGSFASIDRYRFAFLSRRPQAAGLVTEPGGKKRGRFVLGVGYQVQMTADDVSMEQGKGALTAAGITFGLFPETTVPQPEGEDYGAWFMEDAGTIA
jgi:hypothetical protein